MLNLATLSLFKLSGNLDLCNFKYGPFELSAEVCFLKSDILSPCLKLMKRDAALKKIELVLDYCENARVKVDKVRLQCVLLNIMQNAIRASREGGEVEISVSQPERGEFQIFVIDSGFGIPTQVSQKLIDYEVPRVSKCLKAGNSGLGLLQSRVILNGMGGTLRNVKVLAAGGNLLL